MSRTPCPWPYPDCPVCGGHPERREPQPPPARGEFGLTLTAAAVVTVLFLLAMALLVIAGTGGRP